MTRRPDEPHTFAPLGAEMRVDAATGEDRTIFPDAPAAIPAGADWSALPEPEVLDLKGSVAAHQATCGCHPVKDCPDPSTCGPRLDRQGQWLPAGWHLDPLCKVRPEARG